jgi:hypothetical protein
MIVHPICGNTLRLLPDMLRGSAQTIDLNWYQAVPDRLLTLHESVIV